MANSRKRSKSKGILAVVFCIPIIFIAYFAITYSSQAITLDNVNKVTVSAPGASEAVFESQSDIDFFVGMLNGSLSINSAMRDVSEEKPVYIICNREDRAVEYKLYPSLNLSGCLLISPEGQLFVLENETARQLLLREEFSYLYSSYFLPTLSVVSGDNSYAVSPMESEWTYYKSDGIAYSYTPNEYATGDEVYPILQGLDNKLTFTPGIETAPYELTDVSYTSASGEEYDIKDISDLEFASDMIVSVSFTATWNSRGGAQSSGQAKYKFNVLYDVPSTVELLEKEYTWGDIIEINASNLNSDEAVSLDTLLVNSGIGFGNIGGDKSIALIPVGIDNASGEYTLKLTTAADSINETLTVSAKESGEWVPLNATAEQYQQMLSPEKTAEFEQTLASVTAERPASDYFVYGESSLHLPVNNIDATYSFGQKVNIASTDMSGDSGERTVEGVVYELEEGATVRSAQAGGVVFSGNLAPTGNTVVIYHGYGIYSYYYHLDSADVQVGSVVTDGQIIGTAGSTGFTNGKTVLHYAVSIDGVFVDPMRLN